MTFWFGPPERLHETPSTELMELWWGKSADVDAEITRRFRDLYERVRAGHCNEWLEHPSGWVAQIVILDQFPRHMFRGSARCFESDALGLARALEFYDRELFEHVSLPERYFTTMPFTHHEDAASQLRCVRLSQDLVELAPEIQRSWYQIGVDYARTHADIVSRFGRFPHRNAVLGRPNTLEEVRYLEQTPNPF